MASDAIPKVMQERKAFERFVQIAKLPINLASITQPDPPAPDFLCRTLTDDRCGFELCHIADKATLDRLGTKVAMGRHIYDAMLKLPHDQQAQFASRFGNALLDFEFAEGVTANRVRNIITLVFADLLSLPEGFEGDYATFSSPQIQKILCAVNVSRDEFPGPEFAAAAKLGCMGDPITTTLIEKLDTHYECDCPLQLVTYLDGLSMFPTAIWKGPFLRVLKKRGNLGRFEKIWVVDLTQGTIEFVA